MDWHTLAREHPAFVHLPIAAALLLPLALGLSMRSERWAPTVRFLALAALAGALPALATGFLWGRDLGWIAPHRLLPETGAAAQPRLLRGHELWALGGFAAGLAFLALHLAMRAPRRAGRALQLLAALAWAGAWGWTGRQGGSLVFQPRPAPSSAPLDLRAFYQEQCASCHGPDGGGRDASGVRLSGRDLRDPRWQARRTDPQMAAAILDGVGDMPGFRDSLSEADADGLVKEVLRPMARRP